VEESPEVEEAMDEAVATRTGLRRSNGGRACHSVNAPHFERSGTPLMERHGDELDGCRRGKSFEGSTPVGKASKSGPTKTAGRPKAVQELLKPGEPHDRLQGATNLQTVEVSIFGSMPCGENRRSREERQGRNDRGTWQSFDEAWTTVQAGVDADDGHVGEGASMNPMRGVQLLGHGLRAVPSGSDRANRYVSEEGCSGVSIR